MSFRGRAALTAVAAALLAPASPAAVQASDAGGDRGGRAAASVAAVGAAKGDRGSSTRARRTRCAAAARRRARLRRARAARCASLRRTLPRRRFAEQLVVAPAPVPGATDGTLPVPDTTPGDGGPTSQPLVRFASVVASEWALMLSRPVVGAGSVTLELQNVGEDPHNLVVSPDDGSHVPLQVWPETAPGGYLRQTGVLTRGSYYLWCSLEGHEAAGMAVRLRVE